jgi:hypothetical protein
MRARLVFARGGGQSSSSRAREHIGSAARLHTPNEGPWIFFAVVMQQNVSNRQRFELPRLR